MLASLQLSPGTAGEYEGGLSGGMRNVILALLIVGAVIWFALLTIVPPVFYFYHGIDDTPAAAMTLPRLLRSFLLALPGAIVAFIAWRAAPRDDIGRGFSVSTKSRANGRN
jgi:hypothetical protein